MSQRTTVHRKLVRDGIPAKIEANGEIAVTRILTNEEFVDALIDKLKEEAEEVRAAPTRHGRLLELTDVREVFAALLDALNCTPEDIENLRRVKNESVGGFSERIWLESTITQGEPV